MTELRLTKLILLSALMGCALGIPRSEAASAQAGTDLDQPAETVTVSDTPEDIFKYKVVKGQNLTLLARRSVQLAAQEREVELSEAKLIAAETKLVAKLGSRAIDIDQNIDIPLSATNTVIDEAVALTTSQEQRWQAYAPIQMAISETVRPSAAPAFVSAEALAPDPTDTASDTPDQEDAADLEVTRDIVQDDANDAAWYWWFIGGAAVAAMWYILGGDEVISRRRKS